MRIEWKKRELEEVCSVDYGTRVVQKRDGGSIYPVYGGGGATFFMDTFNRENQMVIARFAMSEQCTRFVEGKFFLNDSGLTVSPKDNKVLFQKFLDYQLLFLNDYIYSLSRGAAQKNLDVPAFRTIEIAFPESTSEQKRVATIGVEKDPLIHTVVEHRKNRKPKCSCDRPFVMAVFRDQ